MNYNPLITICFRKGSKRLPGKNMKRLNGQPLWEWTWEQARYWGKGKIVISTDYEKTNQFGDIDFISRPPELAQDYPPYKLPAICHAHKEMERIYDQGFNPVIDLDVCNPVRTVEDIEGCYQKWKDSEQEVVFSVTPARRNPYTNIVERGPNGGEVFLSKYEWVEEGVQVFDINCCIYIYSRDFLMINPKKPTDAPFEIYEMGIKSRFDIDEQIDFDCVSMIMRGEGEQNAENQ